MDLYSLDRLAVSGRSWLHRAPAGAKLAVLFVGVAAMLAHQSLPLYAAALGCAWLLAISARLPLRIFFALSLYPLIFLIVVFLSAEGLTVVAAATLAVRVLAITAAVVLLLLTTSYPAIFAALGHVLPGGFIAALFFTYRSLFILAASIADVRTALYLRGGLSWRDPAASVRNLGAALGHILVHAIEMSERMAENLTVRGFANRIYDLGRQQ